jgi:hypothetical protein
MHQPGTRFTSNLQFQRAKVSLIVTKFPGQGEGSILLGGFYKVGAKMTHVPGTGSTFLG